MGLLSYFDELRLLSNTIHLRHKLPRGTYIILGKIVFSTCLSLMPQPRERFGPLKREACRDCVRVPSTARPRCPSQPGASSTTKPGRSCQPRVPSTAMPECPSQPGRSAHHYHAGVPIITMGSQHNKAWMPIATGGFQHNQSGVPTVTRGAQHNQGCLPQPRVQSTT